MLSLFQTISFFIVFSVLSTNESFFEALPKINSLLDDNSSPQNPINGNQDVDKETLPACAQICSQDLRDSIALMVKPLQSHVERYYEICKKYDGTMNCMGESSCDDKGVLKIMIAGIEYMCKDQKSAFTHFIKCIDRAAASVQSECEVECNTQNMFMKWIVQSALVRKIMSNLHIGSSRSTKDLGQENPHSFQETMRSMTSDMCIISDCILSCMRTKFNARCEGSAGTLLSEVFVRPIAKIQEKMSTLGAIARLAGATIPENCRFLISAHDLTKYRVEPELEQSLYEMYTKADEKTKNTTHAEENLPSNAFEHENLEQKIQDHYNSTSPPEERSSVLSKSILDRIVFQQFVYVAANISFYLRDVRGGQLKCHIRKSKKTIE